MSNSFPILLIDDDPQLAPVLTQAASRSFNEAVFHQVTSYLDAKTYIQSLNGAGPKLVLLDINLKDMVSGLDFLAFLRTYAPD